MPMFAGPVYTIACCAVSYLSGALFWKVIFGGPLWTTELFRIGLIAGSIAAVLSAIYVRPTLGQTHLPWSAVRAARRTMLVALLTGPIIILGYPATLIAHFHFCVQEMVRSEQERKHRRCLHCNYDLRGLSATTCPECGQNSLLPPGHLALPAQGSDA